MGRYAMPRAGGRRMRQQRSAGERQRATDTSRRQLGGRIDDLIGLRAANVAFADKKNGVDGEKTG